MILNGFCKCKDSALMGRSTSTTGFDGAILIHYIHTYTVAAYCDRIVVFKTIKSSVVPMWSLLAVLVPEFR